MGHFEFNQYKKILCDGVLIKNTPDKGFFLAVKLQFFSDFHHYIQAKYLDSFDL